MTGGGLYLGSSSRRPPGVVRKRKRSAAEPGAGSPLPASTYCIRFIIAPQPPPHSVRSGLPLAVSQAVVNTEAPAWYSTNNCPEPPWTGKLTALGRKPTKGPE
jgi:hypothetical protein